MLRVPGKVEIAVAVGGRRTKGPGYEEVLQAAEAILSQEGDVGMNAAVQCETQEPVTMEIVAVRAG